MLYENKFNILVTSGMSSNEMIDALKSVVGDSMNVRWVGTNGPASICALEPKDEVVDNETVLNKMATNMYSKLNRWFGKFEVQKTQHAYTN